MYTILSEGGGIEEVMVYTAGVGVSDIIVI